MYQLTCPSCLHSVSAPFVRVGAVVDCERCGHRYTIESKHLTNSARARSVAAGGSDPVMAQAGQAEAGPASSSRVDEQGNVIGLSGLSNLMRREVAAGGGQPPGHASGAGHTPLDFEDPKPDAGRRARRLQLRRRLRLQRSTFVLIGGLCCLIILFGVVLWAANLENTPPSPPKKSPPPTTSGHIASMVHPPSPDPEAIATQPASGPSSPSTAPPQGKNQPPLVNAQRLAPSKWTRLDPPKPAPAAPASPRVWLVGPIRAPGPDGETFTARVVSREDDPIDRAVVRLMLIDDQNREVARATLPIALVTAQSAVMVSAAIPPSLTGRGLRMRSGVEQIHTLSEGNVLGQATIKARAPDDARPTGVRMVVTNTQTRPVGSLVLVITAWDADRRVIARWRADWPHSLKPDQRVTLLASTPLRDPGRVARWTLTAAGAAAKSLKAEGTSPKEEKAPASASPPTLHQSVAPNP